MSELPWVVIYAIAGVGILLLVNDEVEWRAEQRRRVRDRRLAVDAAKRLASRLAEQRREAAARQSEEVP